jgi:hypothetical protein
MGMAYSQMAWLKPQFYLPLVRPAILEAGEGKLRDG